MLLKRRRTRNLCIGQKLLNQWQVLQQWHQKLQNKPKPKLHRFLKLLQQKRNLSHQKPSKSPNNPKKIKRKRPKLQDPKLTSNLLLLRKRMSHQLNKISQRRKRSKPKRPLNNKARIFNSSSFQRKLRSLSCRSTSTSKRPSQLLYRRKTLSFKSSWNSVLRIAPWSRLSRLLMNS